MVLAVGSLARAPRVEEALLTSRAVAISAKVLQADLKPALRALVTDLLTGDFTGRMFVRVLFALDQVELLDLTWVGVETSLLIRSMFHRRLGMTLTIALARVTPPLARPMMF